MGTQTSHTRCVPAAHEVNHPWVSCRGVWLGGRDTEEVGLGLSECKDRDRTGSLTEPGPVGIIYTKFKLNRSKFKLRFQLSPV